ncbi:hypothetical protein [Dyadobacter frigoris]|uniref:Lipocalin-like domain-containing protein n=1 Tax=Dyadobacter frigoris TaxID=2576211 RepID=A0A4U6D864_9BACT|nr:hypothetical protein [Dyadobacter frigoris]TKT92511.1 hypothetical protein FDK13_11165 [Dyadobacter frigoris]GLU55305.1 hypothetical protein Dfri01_47660 [Dyadobacter frigoris]
MRITLLASALFFGLISCTEKIDTKIETAPSIAGTWTLVSSKVITKGDTVATFPVTGQEMIKIFNENTFAFFKHDLNGGKGEAAIFDSGAGTYELKDGNYSEHLAYCNYRDWENRDFKFKLRVQNDSLIQTGIEKIDSLNVNQEIVEVYVRKK